MSSQSQQQTQSPIGRVVRAARRRTLRVPSADAFTLDALQRRLARRDGADNSKAHSPRRRVRVRNGMSTSAPLSSAASSKPGRPPSLPKHVSTTTTTTTSAASAGLSHEKLSSPNPSLVQPPSPPSLHPPSAPTPAAAAARLHSRHRSDTRETLLSFPEHDAATVHTLLAHFRGDRARVIAKLREVRRRAGKDDSNEFASPTSTNAPRGGEHDDERKRNDGDAETEEEEAGEGGEGDEEKGGTYSNYEEFQSEDDPSLASSDPSPFTLPFAPPQPYRHTRRYSTEARPSHSHWAQATGAGKPPNTSETSATAVPTPPRITGAKRSRPRKGALPITLTTNLASARPPGVAARHSTHSRSPMDRSSVTSDSWRGDERDEAASRSTSTTTTTTTTTTTATTATTVTASPNGFATADDDHDIDDSSSVRCAESDIVADDTLLRTGTGAKIGSDRVVVQQLLKRIAELEQRLAQHKADALRGRNDLRRRMDAAERKMSTVDQVHDALTADLEDNLRRVSKTEQYLDSMRCDMLQAVGKRRWGVFRLVRAGVNNILYYLLAYLVPVLAFVVRCVRDVVVRLRSDGQVTMASQIDN